MPFHLPSAAGWCGCSNFFSGGEYNRVSPFLCASEQAALRVAAEVLETCERELGATFVRHFAGSPGLDAAGNGGEARDACLGSAGRTAVTGEGEPGIEECRGGI